MVAADSNIRKDAYWFGEAQSRVVVSVKADQVNEFKKALGGHPYEELGSVTGGVIELDGLHWGDVSVWKEKYDTAIENVLAGLEPAGALSAL